MKHPIGRPTKYLESFIDEVPKYLNRTGRNQMVLPTREGFSHFIGVHRDSVDEWCRVYPNFSDAIKAIDEVQKQQLMNDGLYGGKEVNSTMAIFLLKVNHGMVETSHTDITSGGKPLVEFDLNEQSKLNRVNKPTT